jgi:hypothetical protein
VSLSSCTGSASTRVFQMFEPGKTRQRDPGTGSATAAEGSDRRPDEEQAGERLRGEVPVTSPHGHGIGTPTSDLMDGIGEVSSRRSDSNR